MAIAAAEEEEEEGSGNQPRQSPEYLDRSFQTEARHRCQCGAGSKRRCTYRGRRCAAGATEGCGTALHVRQKGASFLLSCCISTTSTKWSNLRLPAKYHTRRILNIKFTLLHWWYQSHAKDQQPHATRGRRTAPGGGAHPARCQPRHRARSPSAKSSPARCNRLSARKECSGHAVDIRFVIGIWDSHRITEFNFDWVTESNFDWALPVANPDPEHAY